MSGLVWCLVKHVIVLVLVLVTVFTYSAVAQRLQILVMLSVLCSLFSVRCSSPDAGAGQPPPTSSPLRPHSRTSRLIACVRNFLSPFQNNEMHKLLSV